jgi:hypothetical protein
VTAPARTTSPEGGAVAEVRLSGELAVCDVLAAILAAFPGVRITGQSGPRRNHRDPGHRLYLRVHLDLPTPAAREPATGSARLPARANTRSS